VLNEESGTGSGTLQKTYVGGTAEIAGSNPATGAYSYYMRDNLGSPRAVYDGSKALAAEFDYTPYGQSYAANDTIGITHRYTGHDWDATANLYFAPYRFYNPQLARWMSRDPLGMVDGPNVYLYSTGEPIAHLDPSGGKTNLCFEWKLTNFKVNCKPNNWNPLQKLKCEGLQQYLKDQAGDQGNDNNCPQGDCGSCKLLGTVSSTFENTFTVIGDFPIVGKVDCTCTVSGTITVKIYDCPTVA
jgi:RHS repeat-associated protein